MTFNEARKELAAMVGEKTYRVLYYALVDGGYGSPSQECRVYAHGMVNPTRSHPSWEEALEHFRHENKPPTPRAIDGAPANDINESSGPTPETARPTGTAGGGVAPSISE